MAHPQCPAEPWTWAMADTALRNDERVLLAAPTRRDAEVTQQMLAAADVACFACNDLPALVDELGMGAGALILTDHALADPQFAHVMAVLERQPSWSSLPIVVLCRDREQSPWALRDLDRLRNVTLLDRPSSVRSMVSAVQASLRGRRWQYQIRDQIVAQFKAEEALRLADQHKDQFLATLAHELRNPLAPIKTGLQLLRRSPAAQPDALPVFEMMERQLTQLVRLIDDLLDVSRIATGKMVLRTTRVDMRVVVDSAVEGSQPALDAGRHQLQLVMPKVEIAVSGDSTRLAQALGNVLNNAAKYTAPGGRVTVQLAEVGSDVVVTVTDTGVGIPAPMLERVFDLFAQVDHTLDRAQGGLGIGLSLVRSLLELHGGSVVARSAGTDKGSTFEIRLPAAAASLAVVDDEAWRPSSPVEPPRSLRIMVVDDNVDAADTLGMILGMYGHAVHVEYDAVAALAAADDFAPDFIFCDLGMPGVNGHEFAQRFRQQHHGDATRLVAVTGWGAEEDQRRSQAAGFDHHMTKPVSIESIQLVLAQH